MISNSNSNSTDDTKSLASVSSASKGSSSAETPDALSFLSSAGIVGRDKEVRILQNAVGDMCKKFRDRQRMLSKSSSAGAGHSIFKKKDGPTTGTLKASSVANSGAAILDSSSTSSRTLALISGPSGSGKSALTRQLKETPFRHAQQQQDNPSAFHGFFVSGKCDLLSESKQSTTPFSGMRMALMDMCYQIDHHLDKSKIQQLLYHGLNDVEIEVLSSVIPNLTDVVNSAERHHFVKKQRSGGASSSFGGDTDDEDGGDDDSTQQVSVVSTASSKTNRSATGAAGGRRDGDNNATTKHRRRSRTRTSFKYQERNDQIKFTLRRFMQILCQYCPIIFVIDDMQWADIASMDLFKSWLLDHEITSLFVIGCYRSSGSKLLKDALAELQEVKRERSLKIISIEIGNISMEDTEQFLCRLFRQTNNKNTHDDNTPPPPPPFFLKELALIVYNETDGNPFFIQQYLQSITWNRHLNYDANENRWICDMQSIVENASTNSGVALQDYMKEKVHSFPPARIVLPIAACLGAEFSSSTICVVVRGLCLHSSHQKFFRKLFGIDRFIDNREIVVMLEKCRKQQLIQPSSNQQRKKKGEKSYHFVHDKIQEAALELIPNDDDDDDDDNRQLSELKYRIGEILLFGFSQNNDKIFSYMNMINDRHDLMPPVDSQRYLKIMHFNFMAGMKAIECSAFQLGMTYLECAIKMMELNRNKVTASSRSNVMVDDIELYSAAAECSYVLSDTQKTIQYCDIVISSRCPVLDKARAYHVLSHLLLAGTQGQNDVKDYGNGASSSMAPVMVCVQFLEQLGCQFPKSNFGRQFALARGMFRLKRTSQKINVSNVRSMKILQSSSSSSSSSTDVVKEIVKMNVLGDVMSVGYFTDPVHLMLGIFKTVEHTHLHGMTQESPLAISYQGLIVGSIMGDLKNGARLGHVALEMLKMLEAHDAISTSCKLRTLANLHSRVLHWTRPLEESLESTMGDIHKDGMACGDIDVALWAVYDKLFVHYFMARSNLPSLDSQLSTSCKMMKDFQQHLLVDAMSMFWQAVMNLRGNSDHDEMLIGDAFDERKHCDPDSSNDLMKTMITANKMYLCAYLAKYQAGAANASANLELWLKTVPGAMHVPPMVYHGGLCCYVASHGKLRNVSKKDRMRFKKMARKCHKLLKGWQAKGHPNFPHYVHMLDAEYDVGKGRYAAAADHYMKAIEKSRQRKCVQDEAIANERLGYCWMQLGSKRNATINFGEALKLFRQWGANRRVELLEESMREIM